MSPTPEKRISHHYGLVAALILAAGLGYFCGLTREDLRHNEAPRLKSRIKRNEMTVNASRRTAEEVVRESINGTIDERVQWRQVRDFSEEEVMSAITKLGGRKLHQFSSSRLPEMLFYRWGELDPVAANTAAKMMFPKGFSNSREAVIMAWIKQGGGAAAWNAVKDEGEIWACTRSVPGVVAEMLVASYSNLDDASAFREVQRINDENYMIADTLCGDRARKASAKPETRVTFLAAVANYPSDFVIHCARESLFREWAKRDAKAALAGVMDLPIPEEERESLRHWVRMEARDAKQAAPESP
jgi:hypothetical protein